MATTKPMMKTRNLDGPSFLAKKVLQKLWRDSGWVKRERSARRPTAVLSSPLELE